MTASAPRRPVIALAVILRQRPGSIQQISPDKGPSSMTKLPIARSLPEAIRAWRARFSMTHQLAGGGLLVAI
jgi:hypothetical protein